MSKKPPIRTISNSIVWVNADVSKGHSSLITTVLLFRIKLDQDKRQLWLSERSYTMIKKKLVKGLFNSQEQTRKSWKAAIRTAEKSCWIVTLGSSENISLGSRNTSRRHGDFLTPFWHHKSEFFQIESEYMQIFSPKRRCERNYRVRLVFNGRGCFPSAEMSQSETFGDW